MKNIKDSLLGFVEAAFELKKCSDAMDACGYPDNPFFDNYANVADAIYKLIGEHSETWESSVTYLTLSAPYLTNERRAEMLYAEYKKNFPEQDGNKATLGDIMDDIKGNVNDFFGYVDKILDKVGGQHDTVGTGTDDDKHPDSKAGC